MVPLFAEIYTSCLYMQQTYSYLQHLQMKHAMSNAQERLANSTHGSPLIPQASYKTMILKDIPATSRCIRISPGNASSVAIKLNILAQHKATCHMLAGSHTIERHVMHGVQLDNQALVQGS